MRAIADYFSPQLDLAAFVTDVSPLDDEALVRVIAQLSQPRQAILYEAAKGLGRLSLDQLVDIGGKSNLLGRNAVPLSWKFEKRMFRTAERPDVACGYNEYTFRGLLGPGYFTAEDSGDEVLVDYNLAPPEEAIPNGWPRLGHNATGLSRFVFHDLSDTMRKLTNKLQIGRVQRAYKPIDQWFVTARVEVTYWPHIPL